LLDRAGLFSKNDRGHVYDKFRDRVMFPIHDRRGRVIAFGGRIVPGDRPDRESQAAIPGRTSQKGDDGPKYLNSPETALFHKGRELYGLYETRRGESGQARTKLTRLLVVEGYMDVVSLFQFGVKEAVATLGTATTPEHAELLFRNAPDVYFCFDGDAAGQRAAWRALESVLPRMKDGRQAFFLFLPDGEDPDTIVRQEGAAGFDARLQQAMPLSEFFFQELGKDIKLSTLDGKARLAERARPLLAQIPDGAFGDLMRQQLTVVTGVGAGTATPSPAPAPARRASAAKPGQKPSLVRHIIVRLLHKPALALAIESTHGFSGLRLPGMELLLELLALVHARPDITTGVLLEHFAERDEAAALQKLAMQDLPGDEDGWRQEVLDAAVQLEKQMLQQRLDELQAKQRNIGLDEADKYELRTLLQARIGRH
ncbi:MAG: DNA primase, partial [Pseudoxanthomonas sp.]